MGLVYADIELINADDLALQRRGYLKPDEVRKENIRALVDSGAYMLGINEKISAQLGLTEQKKVPAELADGSIQTLPVVGPVEVRFKNRKTSVDALVLPGDAEVLLGAIPLEGMDVLIDPNKSELQLPPDRPYLGMTKLK